MCRMKLLGSPFATIVDKKKILKFALNFIFFIIVFVLFTRSYPDLDTSQNLWLFQEVG